MNYQKMRKALVKNSDALRQALTGGSVKAIDAAEALRLAHEALNDDSIDEALAVAARACVAMASNLDDDEPQEAENKASYLLAHKTISEYLN